MQLPNLSQFSLFVPIQEAHPSSSQACEIVHGQGFALHSNHSSITWQNSLVHFAKPSTPKNLVFTETIGPYEQLSIAENSGVLPAKFDRNLNTIHVMKQHTGVGSCWTPSSSGSTISPDFGGKTMQRRFSCMAVVLGNCL
ncbi:hypothetical protein E2542_SST09126 [Spatholobus suberectus]|nr:hypothetical protein E2542_SST09126 [Spatholobus suberectus]